MHKKFQLLFLLTAIIGCSPHSNSPLNKGFHNLTAHYNAYFIANEKIKEIESSIYDAQKWNYNKVLPIYPQFDSTMSASFKPILEDIIQKGSIAIQRHPGSKWEDDSYILVGKARYYGSEFADAIETYKYVNTHSEDDNVRHRSLALLIRAYTEFEEYRNANAVVGYLEREELSNENMGIYLLNTAYMHQKKGDLERTTKYLNQASQFLPNDKARLNFLTAQANADNGNDSLAYLHYRQVLKHNPTYELEFYSKLYMAKSTQLADPNDLRKARNYFNNLVKDQKNNEFQDKIFFELAEFELKNGNVDEAITTYKKSIKSSTNNQRQKGLSYLGLGKVYYDSVKNYSLAKNYYDSAISTLPKDADNYEAIKKRQEVLGEFVEQILIVQKNDSLLYLATLPEDTLFALATAKIELTQEVKRKKKEKEKQAALNRARNISKSSKNDELISLSDNSSEWYFDSPNAVSKGLSEFQRKWGDRELEDNWRRTNKAATAQTEEVENEINISESTGEEEEFNLEAEARKMMSEIPKTEEEKDVLLDQIKTALYNLGKIYNLKLNEKENAIVRFEELLSRFPDSEYEPGVLYQLFLLHKNDPTKSEYYGGKLLKNYPESIYAKLVENPLFREEDFAANETLKKAYKNLYKKYENEEYFSVSSSVDSILSIYPTYDFSDNMALLKILCVGKTEEDFKYQYELSAFLEKYPESDLKEYVQNLLSSVENFQKDRFSSTKVDFIKYFDQRHYFIILYDQKANLSDTISSRMKDFIESKEFKSLKTGNLILNNESTMFLVNWFPGKSTASKFVELFEASFSDLGFSDVKNMSYFIITEDNFNILYETKDSKAYLDFYNKNYGKSN